MGEVLEFKRDMSEEAVFLREHSPKDIQEYTQQKVDAVAEGLPTWVVRNFKSDSGRVYDFYRGGEAIGFILHEYDHPGFESFICIQDDASPTLVYSGQSIREAQDAVVHSVLP